MYSAYAIHADRQKLDAVNRCTVPFAPRRLPLVNAFWSLTVSDLSASLLVANPINRYNAALCRQTQKA